MQTLPPIKRQFLSIANVCQCPAQAVFALQHSDPALLPPLKASLPGSDRVRPVQDRRCDLQHCITMLCSRYVSDSHVQVLLEIFSCCYIQEQVLGLFLFGSFGYSVCNGLWQNKLEIHHEPKAHGCQLEQCGCMHGRIAQVGRASVHVST